ncbi:glycosyltransferase [Rubricoccus marinus]|uniref:glycosyltransferase n=1 Tax=Rubricoccus marinus TaxID=716817 RepID=UPI00117A6E78|nr:glycosyltransferase [Rubricoccus marinus]
MIVLAALYALATAVLVAHGLRLLGLSFARLTTSPEPLAPEAGIAWPRVCVQLPVYNEPAVVERAVAALGALDYPDLEIQVLDDSTDSTPQRAARAVRDLNASGVRATHIRRDNREGFKAGALANGMTHTDADLFAIFDADFLPEPGTLRQLVSALVAAPEAAFAQARWAHLNRDASPLTRAQGALLDLHFGVEQTGRQRTGRFLPFNGTAGVWRREAIEAAGGWRGDTLAEDLDLSLRAWMGGARGVFVEPLAVPAELPADLAAWRTQQARWAEGMAAVTLLHARGVLRARQPLALRLRALLAISASFSFPALLAVIVLHPVLAVAQALGTGPGETFFTALGAGWLGLIGAVVAHVVAQRAIGPAPQTSSLWRRIGDLGLGLAAPVALAMTGTRAVGRAVLGKQTAFVRTPKGGARREASVSRAEVALAAYALGAAAVLVAVGAWVALAFQIVFAATLAVSAWREGNERGDPLPRPIPASR